MKKLLSLGCTAFLILGIILPFSLFAKAEEAALAKIKVEGLSALPGDQKVTLLWDAAKLSDGSAIKDYTVFWGTKSVSEGLAESYESNKTISGANVNELGIVKYSVESLENGKKYFFAVKAAGQNITPEYSAEVWGTPMQDASKLPPYVQEADALTKNIVKLTMSKKVKLPAEHPEMAFTITEKGDETKTLEVKKVSFKTNYFLPAGEESKKVLAEEILYIETPDQVKDKEYILTVSATIKDEGDQPVSSGATDSDLFKGSESTTIPETEKTATPSSSPAGSPAPSSSASPSASPSSSPSASPSESASPSPSASPSSDPAKKDESRAVPAGKGSEALLFLNGKVKVLFSENSAAGVLLVSEEKETFKTAFAADTTKKALETGYKISFDDKTERTFSATVTFSYTDEELKTKNIDVKKLVVLTSEDGKKWEEKTGTVDETAKTISVPTTHFSYWTVGEKSGEALHNAPSDNTPPENVTELVASFKAQVKDFLVTLSWKKSLNTAGDLATQLLYVSTDKGTTWGPASDLGGEIDTASFAGTAETEYTFKITTKDTSGNESTGAIASVRLPALPDTGAPLLLAIGMALMGTGAVRMRKK